MIYRIAKWLAGLTLNSYFKRIVVRGYEHVPTKGPTIFIANHPSAFMDPMVVATLIKRPVHFMVAAEFFGNGLKSWIYTRHLNMIPVYRPTTLPNETHNNEAIFLKCFELLGKGGALLVFPEGNSITEKRIRKLKTGVARIALGARENSPDKVDVEVVPIGLNYGNPHRFQSDLFINIGKPLSTKGFSSDPSEVIRFTQELEMRLKETTLHIQHEELDSVVKKVDLILKRKFQDDKVTPAKKEEELVFQKRLVESVQKLRDNQPHLMAGLEVKLDNYLVKLKSLGLSDRTIAELSIFASAGELIKLILTLPLFLIGFVINSIPYYSTVFYFRKLRLFEREGYLPPKKKVNQAFKGSIAMGIGMIIFIAYYLTLSTISVWITTYAMIGIFSLFLFYFSGLFAMEYIGWFLLFEQKWKFRKLLSRKPALFAALIVERQEIIDELQLVTN